MNNILMSIALMVISSSAMADSFFSQGNSFFDKSSSGDGQASQRYEAKERERRQEANEQRRHNEVMNELQRSKRKGINVPNMNLDWD